MSHDQEAQRRNGFLQENLVRGAAGARAEAYSHCNGRNPLEANAKTEECRPSGLNVDRMMEQRQGERLVDVGPSPMTQTIELTRDQRDRRIVMDQNGRDFSQSSPNKYGTETVL